MWQSSKLPIPKKSMGNTWEPLWRKCVSEKQKGSTSHVWIWTFQDEATIVNNGDDKLSQCSSYYTQEI